MNNKNNVNYNKKNLSLIKNKNKVVKIEKMPVFKYEGGSGFECVKFILKPGQSIDADGGAMNYMDSSIKIKTQSGNMSKAFGRLFSGSSFFYNTFINEGNDPAVINLSNVQPGNISAFFIPKGQKINVVSDSYICNTQGLSISTNVRFGGVLLGYGITFVDIEAEKKDGIVWIASFGNTIQKTIKPNESIKIDNGILIAFERNTNIQTDSVGGIASTFLSGEGLVSKIKNTGNKPMRIWLQSRSQTTYLDYIKDKIKKK